MKNLLKNPQIIKGIFCMILLGLIIGYDLNNDFYNLYISKFSQIPVRYTLITTILFIDYLVFENINQYIYIFRYKSVASFMTKSIIVELLITLVLLIVLHIPVFIFNPGDFLKNILIILLSIVNGLIVISFILTIIRLINIWFNNRILSTGLFIVVFMGLDILLDHYSFYFSNLSFLELKSILILPFMSSSYHFIAITLVAIQMIIMNITKKIMFRRDYILKQDETTE